MKRLNYRAERRTGRYTHMRERVFNRDKVCQICKTKSRTGPGEELDHIIPVHIAPDLFWEESNLQMVCKSCHEDKTVKENWQRRKRSPDEQAWHEYVQESI